MTTQEKITLYKTALEYIAEGKNTHHGLCYLLSSINSRNLDIVNFYDCLDMKEKNGLFSEAILGGFEELTNQMIGKLCKLYWFPEGEWEERKQLLINAINILENETA